MVIIILTQNGIPILATILEPLVAVFMVTVAILMLRKYRERKNIATLYLALAILSFALAVLAAATGKLIQFYTITDKNFSGFTIVIAYCFTALAAAFTMVFVSNIFLDENPHVPIIFAILNGVTLGFLIPNISFAEDAYDAVLIYLIWHICMSLFVYISLAYYSFRESKATELKIPKTGFKMIGYFGVFVALLFILFIIDLVMGMVTGSGFTPFYYMAWISGAIASLFAYLGYIMPDWLKNRLSE